MKRILTYKTASDPDIASTYIFLPRNIALRDLGPTITGLGGHDKKLLEELVKTMVPAIESVEELQERKRALQPGGTFTPGCGIYKEEIFAAKSENGLFRVGLLAPGRETMVGSQEPLGYVWHLPGMKFSGDEFLFDGYLSQINVQIIDKITELTENSNLSALTLSSMYYNWGAGGDDAKHVLFAAYNLEPV